MQHPLPRFGFNPAPITLAIALVFSAISGVTSAQTAQIGEVTTLSIASQPLGSALNELSAATGVPIAFSPSIVTGRTAPAVEGNLSLHDALGQLLAGSGLTSTRDGTSVVIQPYRDEVSTLAEVTVKGQAPADGLTEGTGSYTTRKSSTATKLNLSLRETPQSVTVVTRQRLDDFGLTTVHEVLQGTSSVTTQNRGNVGPDYYIRGFLPQSQYDGIPNPIGIGIGNMAATPDTAFLDKVEILQGASGLMSGAGDPGGTINLVRKRPTDEFQAHGEAQFGSWDGKRLVGDISGSLTESGRIRGRAVGLWDDSNSFTDYAFKNRRGFYGIVEADITDTTIVSASVTYQKDKFNDFYGLPMGPRGEDLGLSRSSFFGIRDGESSREVSTYSLNLEQKLPADWLFKTGYTHSQNKINLMDVFTLGNLDLATGDGLSLDVAGWQREFSSNVMDAYVSGPLHFLGREHELVLGGSYSKMKGKQRRGPSSMTPFNVYDFDGAAFSVPLDRFPSWPEEDVTKQSGIYGVARLNLADPLKLILGARASWYEYQQAGIQRQKESGVVSPYAGIIYDLNNNYSVYASYSDIFKPQSQLTTSGSTVDPIVGKNYEMGIKGEFLEGRLNASASVFKLEQTNLAELDPGTGPTDCNGSRCYTASGLVVSKGIDLGLNGEIARGWQVGLGYTYVQSEYGNGDRKGTAYRTYMPKHNFRAHTSYRVPDTAWTVGGDIRVQNKIYIEGAGYHAQQGGYAVVGLMAKYQINKQSEIGLVINNLFDRRYYDTISRSGGGGLNYENFYGSPRNFAVNLKYAF